MAPTVLRPECQTCLVEACRIGLSSDEEEIAFPPGTEATCEANVFRGSKPKHASRGSGHQGTRAKRGTGFVARRGGVGEEDYRSADP
jgi:hypothetical protein